jgi:oligopeptide/dipeptide ABC transporter ATP-binding protein
MVEPLISVKNVSKLFKIGGFFGGKKYVCAVDNVSFSIEDGDTLVLIGESGCGKSTLGRLTLALLKPTSGQVLFRGKDVWRMSKSEFREFRRNAQIIQQNPYDALNPMRTVFQSLAAPLTHYKIARDRREAWEKSAALLESVGLTPPDDFLERYPSRLSGGQMQRVAIARAISVNPKFLVADEAVSMLDASLRIEILDLLLELKDKHNMACLFITHDFGVARYFGRRSRVAVMYLGSLAEIGPIDDVMLEPLHPYTKALIASVPIPDPRLTRSKGLPPLRSLDVPSLTQVPSGCKFHPRCPYAKSICVEKVPELKKLSAKRAVACHLY